MVLREPGKVISTSMTEFQPSDLPRIIELPLWRVDATSKDVEEICRQAREQKLYSVCVASSRVELAASLLDESEIKVTALVGLSGSEEGDVKRYETEIAVDCGAHEIEVCLNVGKLKDGDRKYVLRELRDIAEAADERIVKVEIRPKLLTREELKLACELVLDSGAHFVSAKYIASPNIEDVKACREAVGPKFGVKAGAEILDTEEALALVAAGATRLSAANGAYPRSA
jgi:deoxyribose-phosphate aldolase